MLRIAHDYEVLAERAEAQPRAIH